MEEHINRIERRKTPRKDIYVPIKLATKEGIIAKGHALDISCYGIKLGVKLEITFKTTEEQQTMDQILSSSHITLEIGDLGGKLYMIRDVDVKWSESSYGEGEKIYEAGLDLRLTDEQKQEWENFYNCI